MNDKAAKLSMPEPIAPQQFFQNTPPGAAVMVDPISWKRGDGTSFLLTPDITLHCPFETCAGTRVFRQEKRQEIYLSLDDHNLVFVQYLCSNCRQARKVFAISVALSEKDHKLGTCVKLGENPTFGAPVPSRLLKLLGSDSAIFLKGRQCENQGLGIGAFTYYRRVVESHKDSILGEVLRVAKMIGAKKETLDTLQTAIDENQFKKAMELVKDTIPESLLIKGQNPFTLLHSALSEGVHNLNDPQCLERAQDVRVVLAELADRLGQMLKDESELSQAVKRLSSRVDEPGKNDPKA